MIEGEPIVRLWNSDGFPFSEPVFIGDWCGSWYARKPEVFMGAEQEIR